MERTHSLRAFSGMSIYRGSRLRTGQAANRPNMTEQAMEPLDLPSPGFQLLLLIPNLTPKGHHQVLHTPKLRDKTDGVVIRSAPSGERALATYAFDEAMSHFERVLAAKEVSLAVPS